MDEIVDISPTVSDEKFIEFLEKYKQKWEETRELHYLVFPLIQVREYFSRHKPLIDIEWVIKDTLMEGFDKDLRDKKNMQTVGSLVACLNLLGCSYRQSFLALSEAMGRKEKTVSNAFYAFRKETRLYSNPDSLLNEERLLFGCLGARLLVPYSNINESKYPLVARKYAEILKKQEISMKELGFEM